MKRFYFGGEEENEDEDDFETESFSFPDPSEFIAMTTPLENPDNFILTSSVNICEKSWFWRFLGISTKLKMIKNVFESLKQITEGNKEDA